MALAAAASRMAAAGRAAVAATPRLAAVKASVVAVTGHGKWPALAARAMGAAPTGTPSDPAAVEKRMAALEATVDLLRGETAELRRELHGEIAARIVPIALRKMILDILELDPDTSDGQLVQERATAAWEKLLRESPERVPAAAAGMTAAEVGKFFQSYCR